jgi:hypothetical protein
MHKNQCIMGTPSSLQMSSTQIAHTATLTIAPDHWNMWDREVGQLVKMSEYIVSSFIDMMINHQHHHQIMVEMLRIQQQ